MPITNSIRSEHGFTLVEVLVVMMIVGLLAAAALPGMRRHLANADIRAAAEEMRSGIEQARSEAIRRNNTVRFDRNGTGWNVVLPGSGGTPDTTLFSRAARAQTQVTVTSDVDSISFSGSGWTSPFGQVMNLSFKAPSADACRPGGGINCLNVAVAAGGLVRSCDPGAAAGTATACN
jgi:type IV fimbrial biogenesis protein FimT